MTRTSVTPVEACVVSAICFGYFIFASVEAVILGFPSAAVDNADVLFFVCIELVFGAAALAFLRLRSYDIQSLLPLPTLAGAGIGLCLYVAAWLGSALLATPFMTPQSAQVVRDIAMQSSPTFTSVLLLAVVNGTFEEMFLLGVLVRGLRGYGLTTAIGASLLVRLLYHLYQGPFGAMQVLGFGLVLSLFYARYQNLWPPAFAHIIADVVPFV